MGTKIIRIEGSSIRNLNLKGYGTSQGKLSKARAKCGSNSKDHKLRGSKFEGRYLEGPSTGSENLVLLQL